MKKLKTYSNHKCCPEEWKQTQDLTGSYELDGMIQHTSNKDMIAKLQDYLVSDQAYERRTNYNGGE